MVFALLLLACTAPSPSSLDHDIVWAQAPTDRAVLYLHGSSTDGTTARTRHDEERFLAAGYTMVYPTARGPLWDVEAGQEAAADEAAWLRALRDQLVHDGVAERIYVAGHSLGGSMAWYLACFEGDAFAGFAPSSGTFHQPDAPTACPSGPVALQHVHGLDDPMVPMTGQTEPDTHGARQESVFTAIDLWVAHNHCDGAAHRSVLGPYTCDQYTGCDAPVELCVHEGAHALPDGWEAATVDFFDDVDASMRSAR